MSTNNPPQRRSRISRRGFLSGLSVGAGGAALAACNTGISGGASSSTAEAGNNTGGGFAELGARAVTFDGRHQAGIATPEQANLNLVAFNLREGTDRTSVRRLMLLWTEDARRLTQGEAPLGSLEAELADTPANLTITCGFGPGSPM